MPTFPFVVLDAPAPFAMALLTSAVVAGAAFRARSLSGSGAIAALAIGTAALGHSWGWGAFLICWFVLASLLSRLGRQRKRQRTGGVIEKGERRDAMQVLSNGGLFGLLAGLLTLLAHASEWRTELTAAPNALGLSTLGVGAAAALVAAGADTWATELGTLAGGRPWSLRERRHVAVGTSGAITLVGTLAAAVGAFVLAALAAALAVIPPDAVPLVATSGFAGAFIDTAAGAWGQQRRWCPRCAMATEQRTHHCGTPTAHAGGARLLTNDTVNLLCTVSGAALASLAWWVGHP